MSVLIWVQTVCKCYQKTTKVAARPKVAANKERVIGKPVLSGHSQKEDQKLLFMLNAGQKYCRMLDLH